MGSFSKLDKLPMYWLFYTNDESNFSFLLNKVCVAASNSKEKKTGLFLYASNSSPLKNKSHKNKFLISILVNVWKKNIKQNIRENIVQRLFYETSIKIFRLISKAPTPLLLVCRQILILITYNQYCNILYSNLRNQNKNPPTIMNNFIKMC